ncbi:hypothetical protein [Sphingomonas morindae]|uniref:Uncharacterized protein n=1 Tax=Sphingomonas morindae TaxID=1541170 RepID=A0ABY4X3M8_9SPHN|nr:hypothetical protein [Sphingomonas morindae]USI71471.1 hypothetical protein LHA26_08960 [Sphingomonas morindae]
MSGPGPDWAAALAARAARLATRLAATVPPDVAVALTARGLELRGAALAARSLADPRLRDFAGWLS